MGLCVRCLCCIILLYWNHNGKKKRANSLWKLSKRNIAEKRWRKKSGITRFLTDSLGFERVPDVDVKVVVASEYQASRQGGAQRGHPAHDAAVLVGDELLVSSQVVHLAGGVIWSCYHCITVGEELEEIEVVRKRAFLDRTHWELCTQWKRKSFFPLCSHPNGVDVTLVTCKGLSAGALPDVPQLSCEVTSPWDEELEVWGHAEGHAVSLVSGKHSLLCSCLNVP